MKNFDTAFVLNLKRRPDRLAHFLNNAPNCFEFVTTDNWPQRHDGAKLSSIHETILRDQIRLYDWQINSKISWWARPLKWGEVGCTIGHWEIWQKAYQMDLPQIYVFEDDAIFSDHFLNKLTALDREISARNIDCELLYLGRVLEGVDIPISDRLVIPGYSHCTYAYRLTRGALSKLLSTELLENIIPIDEFLPAMYMQHPRSDIARLFPPRVSALAALPEIVFQRDKLDAGSDTESSDYCM